MKVLVIDYVLDNYVIVDEKDMPKAAMKFFRNLETDRGVDKSKLSDCLTIPSDFMRAVGHSSTGGGRFCIYELGDQLVYQPVLVASKTGKRYEN